MKNLDLYNVLTKRDSWINLSLENISAICRKLGNPQLKYPVIQVGGTNGKTSVTTYISRILEKEGLKTGRYTSPHLESFTERISVDSVNIPEEELDLLVSEIMSISKSKKLSGFEILTACAFKYFAEKEVDVAVLEVGMGGRWDATSAAHASVAVITNVSLDHTEILGDTKEKIALEKISIVKEGVPLYTTESDPAVLKIFERHCSKTGSSIILTEDKPELGSSSVLNVGWQRKNMFLAIAAAEGFLKKEIKGQNLEDIIKEQLPVQGRLETISEIPHIIVDGAHNPAAARELAQALKKLYGDKKITFVLGILADKDFGGIIGQFLPFAAKVIVTKNQNERSLPAEALFNYIKNLGKEAIILKSLKNALQYSIDNWTKGELICITGSLYTVGAAKSYLRDILKADG